MARFYARFDSGSAGGVNWNPDGLELNALTGYFERRFMLNGSASAALLRDGLIASRSALSTDIYNEVDAVNKDGNRGVYFPPDLITTNQSTFISGTIYTSSVDGIRTPTTNTYGSAGINYSRRPTGSIISTQTTLVGPTNPLDSASAVYATYFNASTAARTVLDAIRSGSDTSTNRGPYSRLGNNPSRTLHSIWHDPDLQYFAWDDFTPGQPQGFAVGQEPSTGSGMYYWTTPFNAYYRFAWSATQFATDEISSASLALIFRETGSSTPVQSLNVTIAPTTIYDWYITGPANGSYEIDATVRFNDITIPTSQGAAASVSDAAEIAFTRLYPDTYATTTFNSPCSTTCTNYTGATTYYATSNAGAIQLNDIFYVTTNVSSTPATAPPGCYKDPLNNTFGTDGNGIIVSIGTCA